MTGSRRHFATHKLAISALWNSKSLLSLFQKMQKPCSRFPASWLSHVYFLHIQLVILCKFVRRSAPPFAEVHPETQIRAARHRARVRESSDGDSLLFDNNRSAGETRFV